MSFRHNGWLFDQGRMWSVSSVVCDTLNSMFTEMRITDTFDLLIHIDPISPTALRQAHKGREAT